MFLQHAEAAMPASSKTWSCRLRWGEGLCGSDRCAHAAPLLGLSEAAPMLQRQPWHARTRPACTCAGCSSCAALASWMTRQKLHHWQAQPGCSRSAVTLADCLVGEGSRRDLLLHNEHEGVVQLSLHGLAVGHKVGGDVAPVELHALHHLQLVLKRLAILLQAGAASELGAEVASARGPDDHKAHGALQLTARLWRQEAASQA